MKKLATLTLLISSLIASFAMQSMNNIDPKVLLGTSIGSAALGFAGLYYSGKASFDVVELLSKQKGLNNLFDERHLPELKEFAKENIKEITPQNDNESNKNYLLRIYPEYKNAFNDFSSEEYKNSTNQETGKEHAIAHALNFISNEYSNNKKEKEITRNINLKNKQAKNFSIFSFLMFSLCGYSTYKYFKTSQES